MTNQLHSNTGHFINGTLQPPWETLKQYEKRFENTNKKYKTYLEEKERAEKLIENSDLDKQTARAKQLEERAKKASDQTKSLLKDASDIKTDSQELLTSIENAKRKVQSAIDSLENFGKGHLTLQEAIDKGTLYWGDIKKIKKRLTAKKEESKKIYKHCNKTSNALDNILQNEMPDTDSVKEDMVELDKKLKDIERLIEDIESTMKNTQMRNSVNLAHIERLKNLLDDINSKYNIETELDGINNEISKAVNALNGIERLYDDYEELEFEKFLIKLKTKQSNADQNRDLLKMYISQAEKHAIELERKAELYTK